MKWRKWLENWDMTSLKVKASFLEMEWKPQDADRKAAWELYIELLTRITTQSLNDAHGDEKSALESIYSLFPTTRTILKSNSIGCAEFTKIAIIVLNQVVRPFTAKWHKKSIDGAFLEDSEKMEFRRELESIQKTLRKYTRMLADMAGVEDLTSLEEAEF